ncbi:uncharacterized protein F5147DRAFT_653172 [Suillus discolor]|uniref:Uncharacterized protein n=1 Tax=Suillus discolor TaxID=1912936 RepID=A0A9P7F7D4_9AGAM|nr:uncharacterized protein F5147DRAFT_653172 [Suillus discolor]KAG2107638.1 hypothetical protein F5147DRAFT_653172 [Suillus discolor]
MSFDAAQHRAHLKDFPEYITAGNLKNNYMWQTQKYGRLLMQKSTRQPLNIIMVGCVEAYRFNCGPAGTCFKLDVAGLEKSKQQFHLGKPAEELFAEDFMRAVTVLEKLQTATAKTKEKKNLIVKEYDETMVRFMHRLFKKREKPILQPKKFGTYLEDLENPSELEQQEDCEMVDEETDLWPVPPHLAKELERIKYNFITNPLPIYKDEEFVGPAAVEKCMSEALVEVTFNLEHYAIFKQNEPVHDTFDADILQVNILKDGDDTPLSAFKLHDVHEGPVKLQKKRSLVMSAEEPAAKKTKKNDDGNATTSQKGKQKEV